VVIRIRDLARRLVTGLGEPGGGSPLAAMAAARDLSAATNEALQESVDRVRAGGHSWREIGDVLGTTRQAAFQRFGHPVDPRTDTLMIREIPAGTADRAVALFAAMNEGRWEDVLAEFDQKMREAHDVARLAGGWAHVAGLVGRLDGLGEPFARRAGDDTVVNVPLHFEAGGWTGLVRFSAQGQIAGLLLRPADAP
jgi:hypothetical protein